MIQRTNNQPSFGAILKPSNEVAKRTLGKIQNKIIKYKLQSKKIAVTGLSNNGKVNKIMLSNADYDEYESIALTNDRNAVTKYLKEAMPKAKAANSDALEKEVKHAEIDTLA